MKRNIKYCYYFLCCYSLLFLGSCDLTTSVEDFQPPYSLEATNAITNEATAGLALAGIYGSILGDDAKGIPLTYIVPEFLNGNLIPNYLYVFQLQEFQGFVQNQPVPLSTVYTNGMYMGMYNLINQCNWFIQELNKLPETVFALPSRKQEMLGEAHGMRALAYFYLLRLYTPFYDVDSKYGLDIRITPALSDKPQPRQSVAKTYEVIHEDLDYAIANAPDFINRYHFNKTMAQALKAKTYLYEGNYVEAAKISKEIINNQTDVFDLSVDYLSIYYPHTTAASFENQEILFGTPARDQVEELGMGTNYGGRFVTMNSPVYLGILNGVVALDGKTIAYDGPRKDLIQIFDTTWGPQGWTLKYAVNIGNLSEMVQAGYPDACGEFEMAYHMRMAEVFLIYAEAEARAKSSVSAEALKALNDLRKARGAAEAGEADFAQYPNTVSLDQFLELVRIEKVIELTAEMGEPWFDLIRYDYADGFGQGFQVSQHKATATDPHKFILPIPETSLQVSHGVVVQNPSY